MLRRSCAPRYFAVTAFVCITCATAVQYVVQNASRSIHEASKAAAARTDTKLQMEVLADADTRAVGSPGGDEFADPAKADEDGTPQTDASTWPDVTRQSDDLDADPTTQSDDLAADPTTQSDDLGADPTTQSGDLDSAPTTQSDGLDSDSTTASGVADSDPSSSRLGIHRTSIDADEPSRLVAHKSGKPKWRAALGKIAKKVGESEAMKQVKEKAKEIVKDTATKVGAAVKEHGKSIALSFIPPPGDPVKLAASLKACAKDIKESAKEGIEDMKGMVKNETTVLIDTAHGFLVDESQRMFNESAIIRAKLESGEYSPKEALDRLTQLALSSEALALLDLEKAGKEGMEDLEEDTETLEEGIETAETEEEEALSRTTPADAHTAAAATAAAPPAI